MRFDAVVIGGGASGMLAAGRAAECGENTVLLERNERVGKKLLITGKGRSNITNTGEIEEFIACYGKNGKFLYRAFSEFFNRELVDFFERYGVETKVERGGRVFPSSDTARSILTALEKYLNDSGVTVRTKSRVEEILIADTGEKTGRPEVSGVRLKGGGVIESGRVVLATGGLSYPKTGSTGDGYRMAEKLGHTIVPLRPGLVPLETKEDYVKDLQGLSLKNINATIYGGNKKIDSELGEMIFTHFGVSGPVVLKMSGQAGEALERGSEVFLSINLKPGLDAKKLDNRLLREFKSSGKKSVGNIMKNLLPKKLVPVFINITGIVSEKKCSQVTVPERKKIAGLLQDFRFRITGTRPIDEAIITRGGIALNEIDPRTMESKVIKGLFFCGEIMDIDGVTGGYNLQAAFSTGYLAGKK